MLCLIISLYILAYGVFAEKANPSITLTCTRNNDEVLLEQVDDYVCKVQLSENGKRASKSIFRTYINSINEFSAQNRSTKCSINLIIDTSDGNCYCNNNDCNEIVWNVTALQNQSSDFIRAGWLYNESKEVFSETVRMPHIIKAPRIKDLHVSVNNQIVRKNDTIRISNAESKLNLILSSDDKEALKVCTLDYDTDYHHMKSGITIILKPENITIKVKMCRKELVRYNLKILYEDELKKTTFQSYESSTKILADESDKLLMEICIATLAIVCAGVFTQFIYYSILAYPHIKAKKREIHKNRKEKKKKESAQLENPDQQKFNLDC